MQSAAVTVALVEFALIGLLPRIFFRKGGQYNLLWFLTAAPYALSALNLGLGFAGVVPPLVAAEGAATELMQASGAVAAMLAFGLTLVTIGSHPVPLALWHQPDDAPRSLVTWGPYKLVRHPFYASFLLALLASCLIAPSWLSVVSFFYGLTVMELTARREEAKLAVSSYGEAYRLYAERTGRFLPRLSWRRQAYPSPLPREAR